MLAAAMIVVGLALLFTAAIPQTWAPVGRAVLAVNTALPFGVRAIADAFHQDEAEVQEQLVKVARVVFGFLGVMLILGAATYGATG